MGGNLRRITAAHCAHNSPSFSNYPPRERNKKPLYPQLSLQCGQQHVCGQRSICYVNPHNTMPDVPSSQRRNLAKVLS